MMNFLHKLGPRQRLRSAATIPPGERVYAVGDVHGRLDLLNPLMTAIEIDDAARSSAQTTIILLGDLIDRGPQSSDVLAAVRVWQQRHTLRVLWGNHEEVFVRSFEDLQAFRALLLMGGRETLRSYPIDWPAFEAAGLAEAQAMMIDAVPQSDLDLITSFEDYILIGDYLFVHAGIRPGVPPHEQDRHTLRWIRKGFLDYGGHHPHVVVHGHTVVDEPYVGHSRIGLDTGAYASGCLTALMLEGDTRQLMAMTQAGGDPVLTVRSI